MLVLDANILMRAVLGRGARSTIERFGGRVDLAAPDVAFEEARKRLPPVFERRSLAGQVLLQYLDSLSAPIRTLERTKYQAFEAYARLLLKRRDEDDWPILAAALALECPIWTEDTDFFGCGVATWTSDRVDIYLEKLATGDPLAE